MKFKFRVTLLTILLRLLYRRKDWDGAVALFEQLLRDHSSDRASAEMLNRCRRFQFDPPPPNWD